MRQVSLYACTSGPSNLFLNDHNGHVFLTPHPGELPQRQILCLVHLCNRHRRALVIQMLPMDETSLTLQSKMKENSLGKKKPFEERLCFRLTSLLAHFLELSILLLLGEGKLLKVENRKLKAGHSGGTQ